MSERFAAVDMDLSEDSVDLEEAVLNGIHLLNVCSVYVRVHVCMSVSTCVYMSVDNNSDTVHIINDTVSRVQLYLVVVVIICT